MGRAVVPPDLEAFLCGYLRDALGCEVGNVQPAAWDGSAPLVVVRDDSGPKTGPTTFDRSVGVTCYAGTRQDPRPAMDLARRAMCALTCPAVVAADGSPVAAVVDDGCNGPYRVDDDHDVGCCYLTAEFSAVGEVTEL